MLPRDVIFVTCKYYSRLLFSKAPRLYIVLCMDIDVSFYTMTS